MTYTLYTLDPDVPLPPGSQPAPTDNTFYKTFTGAYSRLTVVAVYPALPSRTSIKEIPGSNQVHDPSTQFASHRHNCVVAQCL